MLRGARTFMVKVKAHRGEPLNERADTQAENARQLPSECRQWTTRSQRMTYEWSDNDGVKHVRGQERRAKQVITCSFPCGKWLHMIGARASPGCELCKRARNMDLKTTDVLPTETVAHIQSAGCKAQQKSVKQSLPMVKQQETWNSLEEIKTDR